MTIVQILPELESGGVEKGTLEVSNALVVAGYESVVISNGGRLVKDLEAAGATHYTLPVHKKSLSSLFQIRELKKLLQKIQPEIVHARSRVPAWMTYLAWKSMNEENRPRFMTTFHGFHSVSPYSGIMAKGERVIAVSDSIKQHILTNYQRTEPRNIIVNHRGVDTNEYSFDYQPEAGSEARILRENAKNSFVVTLPGRITSWKGGEDFLKVIHGLSSHNVQVEAWFAGGAHPKRVEFEQKLRSQANELGIAGQVKFLGHRNDMKDLLSVSDAVVSLSTKPEAFGRVSLESLCLGTPVAAYAHGGVAEQMASLFPEGQVRVGDVSGLVSLLSSWSKTLPLISQKDHPFTLEKMTSKTLAVYEELCSER